jgi:tetratricopeptide (TPR) repeat protein
MTFPAIRCLILILLLGLFGCDSGPETSLDEQKDPHYLNGRSRVSSQDYKGAVEEFEKALEANPRSASAHFELGWLNEEQMKDYAAAIYHYEQHLKLRPTSDYASRAKERIGSCKMDLVKNEILAPVNQGMQRDLDRLGAENLLLKRQLEALQAQVAARPNAPVVPSSSGASVVVPEPVPQPRATNPEPRNPVAPAHPKTHVVKSGETITGIAARYNVKLNVFLAANPKADPRRLKVGQTLIIPSPSP